MRINTNNLVFNNISRINNNIEKNKRIDSDIEQKSFKNRSIIIPNVTDKDTQAFSTIYNNANLSYKLNAINNYNDEESDEEINLQLDKDLYERYHLKDNGIKFNSPEFKKWVQEHKDGMVIPVDAPTKLRKKISDMFNAVSNENKGLKIKLSIELYKIFGNNKDKDVSYITDKCTDVIRRKSDYVNVVKMCGSDSEIDRKAIDTSNKVIDFFRQLGNFIKLNYE